MVRKHSSRKRRSFHSQQICHPNQASSEQNRGCPISRAFCEMWEEGSWCESIQVGSGEVSTPNKSVIPTKHPVNRTEGAPYLALFARCGRKVHGAKAFKSEAEKFPLPTNLSSQPSIQ